MYARGVNSERTLSVICHIHLLTRTAVCHTAVGRGAVTPVPYDVCTAVSTQKLNILKERGRDGMGGKRLQMTVNCNFHVFGQLEHDTSLHHFIHPDVRKSTRVDECDSVTRPVTGIPRFKFLDRARRIVSRV